MQRVSFPDFTAFSADAFWKSGGIFLSCQIIGTGWTRLASLPACLLPTFTQHSRWHRLRVSIQWLIVAMPATMNPMIPIRSLAIPSNLLFSIAVPRFLPLKR